MKLAESLGTIRYLRVSNRKDLVAIMPFRSLFGVPYKHVGVELKLRQDKHIISYPRKGNKAWRKWRNSLFNNLSWDYLTNHGCQEYGRRLDLYKETLDNIYLNDIYADKKIVGDLKKVKRQAGFKEEL